MDANITTRVRRTGLVGVRVSPEEMELLALTAELLGLSVPALLRLGGLRVARATAGGRHDVGLQLPAETASAGGTS